MDIELFRAAAVRPPRPVIRRALVHTRRRVRFGRATIPGWLCFAFLVEDLEARLMLTDMRTFFESAWLPIVNAVARGWTVATRAMEMHLHGNSAKINERQEGPNGDD